MSQGTAPRTPCLPADTQKELEELREALHDALGWWSSYHADSKSWKDPYLFEAQGEEADEYRRCRALLDPPKAE